MSDADPMATEDEVERQRRMAMLARTNAQNQVNTNFANANASYDQMQQRANTEIQQRGAQNNVDAAAQQELQRIANRPLELRRASLTQAQASQGADDQWRRAQVDGYFNKVQAQRTMMQEAAAAMAGGGGGGGRGGGGGGGGGGGSSKKSGDAATIVGEAKARQADAARNLPQARAAQKAKALGKRVLASAMPKRKSGGKIKRGRTEVQTRQSAKSDGANIRGVHMYGKNSPVRLNKDGGNDPTINEYFGSKGVRGAMGRAVETNARRGLQARRAKAPGESLFAGNEGVFGKMAQRRFGAPLFNENSRRDQKIAEADQMFADADNYVPQELQVRPEEIARQIAVEEYGWDPSQAYADIPDYFGMTPYQNFQAPMMLQDQQMQLGKNERDMTLYGQGQQDRQFLIDNGINPALGYGQSQQWMTDAARQTPEYQQAMRAGLSPDDDAYWMLPPDVQRAINEDSGF